MFQFLLGTLKTVLLDLFFHILRRFQFLLGTLKTLTKLTPILNKSEFQFLLGTLKTDGWFGCGCDDPGFNSS